MGMRLALQRYWPEIDAKTCADWLTDYAGAKYGTPGYCWTANVAKTLAREYVSECGSDDDG